MPSTTNTQPLVLVTGSCGLIGSEVSVYFHRAGFRIAGIDSNARAQFFGPEGDTSWVLKRLQSAIPGYMHHAVDIRDRARILEILSELRPALVIHTAAQPSHDRAAAIPFDMKNGDSATADTKNWDPGTWQAVSKGFGFTEAPRGALCHWIRIKDRKIAKYQIVVPSTWNASPKDGKGQHGAYESALLGTPMADPKRPVEILRTIHSFDPCLACASHVIGPDGETLAEIVVR